MDKYENLGMVGEGSYGVVIKCRHKETGQIVAIKKFLDTEDDKNVKKIAMREIRMLKQLRHENLVGLIEVFRKKKRLYLVFEYVDHTVLDEIEKHPTGLDELTTRKLLYQVIRGTEFCHMHNIIHRDVKPENILVSKLGVVKLCDFGFARPLAPPGESHTDYVATRWYRAPELLVGDTKYGKAVDIWAIGCLFAEMLTSEPLFPGESDLDQLYHILRCFGSIASRHREVFYKNNLFAGKRLPEPKEVTPLEHRVPKASATAMELLKQCLILEPDDRPGCAQLLRHEFFQRDNWAAKFGEELQSRVQRENETNPLLRQQQQPLASQTPRHSLSQSQAAHPSSQQAQPDRDQRISPQHHSQQPAGKHPNGNAARNENAKKMPIQFQMQLMQQQRKAQQQQPPPHGKRDSAQDASDETNEADDREREREREQDASHSHSEAGSNADEGYMPPIGASHPGTSDWEKEKENRERERHSGLSLPPASQAQHIPSLSIGANYFSGQSLKGQEKSKKVNNMQMQYAGKKGTPPNLSQGGYYQSMMGYHAAHQSDSRQSNFSQYGMQSPPRKNGDFSLPEVRGVEMNKTMQLNLLKFKKGYPYNAGSSEVNDDDR